MEQLAGDLSFSQEFIHVAQDQGTWHANALLQRKVTGRLLEADGPACLRTNVPIVSHGSHLSQFPQLVWYIQV